MVHCVLSFPSEKEDDGSNARSVGPIVEGDLAMFKSNLFRGALFCGVCVFGVLPLLSAYGEGNQESFTLPPSVVADLIHSVIQADRTLYATHIVERMEKHKVVTAQEY